MNNAIISVKDLTKYFPVHGGGFAHAVDGVSFSIAEGETLGLVGESGSGKTTIGKTMLRMIPKTSGEVFFRGRDLYGMSRREIRAERPKMQYIFQDPFSSLNPRMTVGRAIAEPLLAHGLADRKNVREKVGRVLEIC
ncbi:MAG: ATP-binding cassette domain-containing protein, partial [Synergistaceae bacterium]|nr:ATP-binding cassette domain-containing protein [Synergistaceae bacterium]